MPFKSEHDRILENDISDQPAVTRWRVLESMALGAKFTAITPAHNTATYTFKTPQDFHYSINSQCEPSIFAFGKWASTCILAHAIDKGAYGAKPMRIIRRRQLVAGDGEKTFAYSPYERWSRIQRRNES